MKTDKPKSTRGPGLSAAAIVVVVLALGTAAFLGMRGRISARADHLADVPVFTVKRGPLTISVTESGTIKSREQVIIKSEVEGTTTIISLTPEGTCVKQGDLLVELDVSRLQDSLIDQQIRVENTEAAFIRARESLAVVENQAKSDVVRAELDYQFAKEDLKHYVDGNFPKELKEAESRITLAAEEMKRATEKLKWSEKLFSEKYVSQTELEGDRLARNRTKLDHELAQAARDLLKDFTYKRNLDELESNIDQTGMALKRARRKASADVVQAEAELKAKLSELEQQKKKLHKIEQQIEKTKIHAPTDGMVVFATSAKGGWHGNAKPLDEGQAVRERQELIYLPTAGAMMADVKVHESSLDKVRPGLPVRITVDALPGRAFQGRVAKIAPLPDAQSIWLNPDLKIYRTEIDIDDSTGDMRTGMSCRAEIIVEHYPDATYVPVQTVLRVGSQPTVYVANGNHVETRTVELGLDNNRMVHIVNGLETGENVLLTPPLTTAASIEPEPAQQDKGQRVRTEPDPAAVSRTAEGPRQAVSEGTPGSPSPSSQAAGRNDPDRADNKPTPGRPQSRERSLEERQKMREIFRNLPPEERERLRR